MLCKFLKRISREYVFFSTKNDTLPKYVTYKGKPDKIFFQNGVQGVNVYCTVYSSTSRMFEEITKKRSASKFCKMLFCLSASFYKYFLSSQKYLEGKTGSTLYRKDLYSLSSFLDTASLCDAT